MPPIDGADFEDCYKRVFPLVVTFSLGVALSANLIVNGELSSADFDSSERNATVSFGSVQRAGLVRYR